MKNYWIIGASSGIGRSLTEMLSEKGHRVYATYCKNEFSLQGVESHYLNVLDENWDTSYLPERLDGLVYCPGSINLKPFKRISADAFLSDYQLQVLGAVKAVQAALPRLKTAPSSVVFFSTVAVGTGFNFHTQVAASKGAVEGLTRSLAAEFAPTIRFNCIAPSLTDTPLAGKLLGNDQKREANAQRHPMKRIGDPEDLAHAAEFLLSEKTSWMTGQILHVDGGMSAIK